MELTFRRSVMGNGDQRFVMETFDNVSAEEFNGQELELLEFVFGK